MATGPPHRRNLTRKIRTLPPAILAGAPEPKLYVNLFQDELVASPEVISSHSPQHLSSVSPVSIFSEARERVREEIDSIVECLGNKKDRMVEEIDSLEKEFVNKQRERQKDITKLNTLIAHTEELGQNTLLKLQQKVIKEIQLEIQTLEVDSKQVPGYRIGIRWGFSKQQFVKSINKSTIQANSTSVADCLIEHYTDSDSSNDSGPEVLAEPSKFFYPPPPFYPTSLTALRPVV